MAYKRTSPMPVEEGGTAAITLTDHAVIVGSGVGAVSFVGPVASTGALLASSGVGSDPGFTTATYPLTTTANQILYSSATNTVSEITSANDGALITSAAGVPSISSTLPSAVQGNITSVGTIASGTWNGTDIAVADGGTGSSTLTGVLTGNGTSAITANAITQYGVLVGGASNAVDSTVVGTATHVLTSNGAGMAPTFQAAAGGITGPVSSTDNALARWNGTGGTAVQDSTVIVTDNGEMTNASQPAFFAFLATSDTNATGNNTEFQIGSGNALTETFDQNSDFNTNGTFTCPVTAKVLLQMDSRLIAMTGATVHRSTIITSNRSYINLLSNYPTTSSQYYYSVLADMDAMDTATFSVAANGIGADTATLQGLGTPYTFVAGSIIC